MAVATLFSPVMAQLTGNTGGAVQSLPPVTLAGARDRVFAAAIALAAQAAGSVIAIARIPLGSIITGIVMLTDTSLGAATVEIGDTNTPGLYSGVWVLTSANVPVFAGNPATTGVPIVTGYDCISGASTKNYEDIVLTTGAAALPGAGNLMVIVKYALD